MATLNDIRLRASTQALAVSGITAFEYGTLPEIIAKKNQSTDYPLFIFLEPEIANISDWYDDRDDNWILYNIECYITTTEALTDANVAPTHDLFLGYMHSFLKNFHNVEVGSQEAYAVLPNIDIEFKRHWESLNAAALKFNFQIRVFNCFT